MIRVLCTHYNNCDQEFKDAAELQALPTSTEIDVDLREPLLESNESQAIA